MWQYFHSNDFFQYSTWKEVSIWCPSPKAFLLKHVVRCREVARSIKCLPHIFICFPVAVIKTTLAENNLGKKVFTRLTLPGHSRALRTSRQNLKGENLWLSHWSVLSHLSHKAQTPGLGMVTPMLDPPSSIIKQDSLSQTWPQANLTEATLQLRFPSLR